MTMTREQVESLLSRAPEGPWRADGEPWNRIVWSGAENRVCFMAHSNGLNDDRDVAASDLAAAAPDLARALLAALGDLDAVKAELHITERLLLSEAETTLELGAANAAMTEREGVLRSACAPFKDMAGEMFARNWNRDQVAIALDNPGDPHRLMFGDFLDLHAALQHKDANNG